MEKPHSIPTKPKKKGSGTLQVMEEFVYFWFLFQHTALATGLIIFVYSLWQSALVFFSLKTARLQCSRYDQYSTIYLFHRLWNPHGWSDVSCWSSSNSFNESNHWLLEEAGERVPGTWIHLAVALLSHPLFNFFFRPCMVACSHVLNT